ncbi:TROVE domain-containing protein [Desertifilum sp. FACHB-1129]|uniref:TROVE domain-containing protein n=1 Tax=Desertifilum tharense IPPAS B-1220 TaxID=1781255 RepID=A0A1E5QQ03_9CYAN|nr:MULTISPECIES: TROVE domain-containing protein [Desertifilum]MDA0212573.1 TROVE domain-containing protein [Cyanobacteria bacterium FC1]MBD2314547.1 TROVE domain-containing protein [Desertifilum sp. FACHB-1129]MBD2321777.1 TROVE domain-containing protein [Desertifilum sp. FACHB-866]MBD2331904.1 TROVE domain-containing protein [Desertifilum sp. FACHB-868]OEJ76739.1 TROVE domain-containing protein [Desertifilum tharense IPPAS B-1220]
MNYNFYTQKQTGTPQNQPIPGRETQMIQGRSGGWMFKAGLWRSVRRCLLIGTAQSTYYADKRGLTGDFVKVLKKAIAQEPDRVAQEILYASDGRAINNSAPILALVLLSMGETPEAKRAFMEIFPQVVRTGSHFYEWLSYTKAMRGMGKVIREAGKQWLSREDVKGLAYQLLKYQQRQGFAHRDALRLFHVKPPTEDHNLLFQWVVKGWDELPSEIPSEVMAQIWWFEWLKRHPQESERAIAQGRLTHEMAAPVGKMDRGAWQLLFDEMPIGAMLRNLASLTQIGVLEADNTRNLERVESVLNNPEHLRKGRIHPIDVLKALKTYKSKGRLGRSQKTWKPVSRIIGILERAVELSFNTIEPTGKVFLHAVDVSGSMSYSTVNSVGLTCCEIATAMALVTAKAETHYTIRGFATEFRNLKISASDSFSSALKKASDQNFGGTDAAVAYEWATKHKFKADVICFWTDNESWSGYGHPSQALAAYRKKVNPEVKAIYVTLAPYGITLVDPHDPLSWDFAGFDPGTPKAIQMLAAGDL